MHFVQLQGTPALCKPDPPVKLQKLLGKQHKTSLDWNNQKVCLQLNNQIDLLCINWDKMLTGWKTNVYMSSFHIEQILRNH